MYRLSKRVISQFIRTGCRRRLRLDLYRGIVERRLAGVPEKDARRPGLALLTQQGKEYERAKFKELEDIFPELVVRGALKVYETEEDRAFEAIELATVIDRLTPNQFALEAQFEITDSFKAAHYLADLVDGTAVAGGYPLGFEALRPDILQVRAHTGDVRRIVTPAGCLERVGAQDKRLGLRIIDIKISGEPSPAHFAELAYYGMALAGWFKDTGRDGRFVVLADAAIWPGAHDGSTMQRLLREDRSAGVPVLDLQRYLRDLDPLDQEPEETGLLVRHQRLWAILM